MPQTTITWNRPMLARFKKAYNKAVEDKVETFVFDGHEFVPAYAKYLIEYLTGQLK